VAGVGAASAVYLVIFMEAAGIVLLRVLYVKFEWSLWLVEVRAVLRGSEQRTD